MGKEVGEELGAAGKHRFGKAEGPQAYGSDDLLKSRKQSKNDLGNSVFTASVCPIRTLVRY